MEHYIHTEPIDHHIESAAAFMAVTRAAETIQYAADQRIDPSQKHRTRELGKIAEAHLALEPTAVAHGLTLTIDSQQAHDVAIAALFYTGTSRYDILQEQKDLPADTILALQALKAQAYTPLGAKDKSS